MTHTLPMVQDLRSVLSGLGLIDARDALSYASRIHVGRRLDGSPEISHQIDIGHTLLNLDGLPRLETCLVVGFLHDVREDYGISHCALRALFGVYEADAIAILTKKFRGISTPPWTAYRMAAASPVSAVVKGADRLHNLRTMSGAFSSEKQASYRLETELHITPMLRSARNSFPSYAPALDRLIASISRLTAQTPVTTRKS